MSEKTIALSGAEVKVTFSGGNAWLRNDGASAVYAAKTAGVAAGADGVISIPAGGSAPVYGANGTVFLLGSGSVQLIGSDYATNPFVGDSFGGGADTSTNAAGIVTLDGLQGGVPFSEIVLGGDIKDAEITLRSCGKNLIRYPYDYKSGTISGVNFTINEDGSVSAVGTAAADAFFFLAMRDFTIYHPGAKYTLSGCPGGGSENTYCLYTSWRNANNVSVGGDADYGDGVTFTLPSRPDVTALGITIRVSKGVTVDAVFRPQLEIGDSRTAYEPYHGSSVTVTPDSVPYTVPNDIRQQDGINNVMVSAGEVKVTGVRRNAAIKRIWDKLDELTAALIVANGEI